VGVPLLCPSYSVEPDESLVRNRPTASWAYAHEACLDFIRPGKPVENAVIESFDGKLRDE
jgi:putative transposase